MPVRKFRSITDMPDPPRLLPGDPALYRAMAGVWESGRWMNPRRFPPGVHKYRSIEEMSRVQEEWATEHARSLAASRRGQ